MSAGLFRHSLTRGCHASPRNSFDGAIGSTAQTDGSLSNSAFGLQLGRENTKLTMRLSHASEIGPEGLADHRHHSDLGRDRDCQPPSTGRRSTRDLGTWKWSVNKTLVMTLRLKHEGETLTGILIGNDGPEKEIEDGKYDDGKLSFKVTSRAGKGDVTAEYAAIPSRKCHQRRDGVYFGPGRKPYPATCLGKRSDSESRKKNDGFVRR